MHYVYVLQSEINQRLYIGYSTDYKKRLKRHNAGESKSTKPYRPYKLLFYEAYLDRKDAKAREKYLKSGWGRRSLNKMLRHYFNKH